MAGGSINVSAGTDETRVNELIQESEKWTTISAATTDLEPGAYIFQMGSAFAVTLLAAPGDEYELSDPNFTSTANALTIGTAGDTFTDAAGNQVAGPYIVQRDAFWFKLICTAVNEYRVIHEPDAALPPLFQNRGGWDASTNTPDLTQAVNQEAGNQTYKYLITNGGTQDIGQGSVLYQAGGEITFYGGGVFRYDTPPTVLASLTQAQAEDETSTVFAQASGQRIFQAIEKHRPRGQQLFHLTGGNAFDFDALNYPNQTVVILVNTSSVLQSAITYGTGGTTDLRLSSPGAAPALVNGQNDFNLGPEEIAIVEQASDIEVCVSIISPARILTRPNEAAAVGTTFNYRTVLHFQDTGQLWGRKTTTNQAFTAVEDTNWRLLNPGAAANVDRDDVLIDVDGTNNTIYSFAGGLTWAQVKAIYAQLRFDISASDNGQSLVVPHTVFFSPTDLELFKMIPGNRLINESGVVINIAAPSDADTGFTYQQSSGDAPGGDRMRFQVTGIRDQKMVIDPAQTVVDDQAATGYIDIGTTRIQWGVDNSGTTTRTVNLPALFANTEYTVTASADSGAASPTADNSTRSAFIGGKTTASFQMRTIFANNSSDGGTSQPFSWQAIGVKP